MVASPRQTATPDFRNRDFPQELASITFSSSSFLGERFAYVTVFSWMVRART